MNYYTIYDWMTDELRLKGTELLCYALIYSYAKSGKPCTDSLASIAARTGVNKATLVRIIGRLAEAGHITKERDGRSCVYKAVRTEPVKEKAMTPDESAISGFNYLWAVYGKGARKKAEAVWSKMTREDRDIALVHAGKFVKTREWGFLPDLYNYLKNQEYMGMIDGKPVRKAGEGYHPELGDNIKLNLGRYYLVGSWVSGQPVSDGYEDSERSVGAELDYWDGTIVWTGKEWRKKNGSE